MRASLALVLQEVENEIQGEQKSVLHCEENAKIATNNAHTPSPEWIHLSPFCKSVRYTLGHQIVAVFLVNDFSEYASSSLLVICQPMF